MTIRRKQAEFRIKSKPSKFVDQSQYLVASGNMTTFPVFYKISESKTKTLMQLEELPRKDLLMEIEKRTIPFLRSPLRIQSRRQA